MEELNKKRADVRENDIVFSKSIKAGKRIYYLDVKRNKKDEFFLAITESKKVKQETGEYPFTFEKHKIFLYKEDFDKFMAGFEEVLTFIKENTEEDTEETMELDEKVKIMDTEFDLKLDF